MSEVTQHRRVVLTALVVAGLSLHGAFAFATPFLSDTAAVLTINGDGSVDAFKDLHGLPGPGYALSGVDVLYSGDSGTWSFDLSGVPDLSGRSVTATFIWVADDHYDSPLTNYTGVISLGGSQVFSGLLPVQHGVPFAGQPFTNLTIQTYGPVDSPTSPFLVTVQNTNSQNIGFDWIAIDSINIHVVPEPATLLLFGTALAGLCATRSRRRR